MRRSLLRILIGLAALIVLVVILVQLVLWTNIPKNLLVKQIEREMGLRISTDSLTTGWLGRSTLSNVALGLPLSRQSFLKVKTLKVKHTTLIGLLLGRSVSIDYIEIDQPDISVVQDNNGQWNLTEVTQLLARLGGGKPAADAQSNGIPKLPNVRLINGTIHVTDNQQHTATLAPLNVNGYAADALVWNYELKLAEALALTGRVAPGGSWKHQVRLSAHDLDALLKPWNVNSQGADIVGDWQGRLDASGAIAGTLSLDHARVKDIPAAGDMNLSGAVEVQGSSGEGGAITLRPRRLDLKTGNPALGNVWVAAGTIVQDGNGVRAQTMQVAALGGLAVLDATFDPRTMAGDLSARWNGLALTSGINHSGSVIASLRMPFAGHPQIKLDLISQGSTASGKWDTKVNVLGEGTSWKSIDWVMTAPTLNYITSRPIQLAQLTAHVQQRWPHVELTDLTLPLRPHLLAKAAWNAKTHNWYFWLDAGGARSTAGTVVPINFSVNAWGDEQLYTLHEMNLRVADAAFWASGFYDRRQPNPMNLDIYLTQSPELLADAPIQGHVSGKFNLSGQVFKEPDGFHPHLTITGSLTSSDLVVLKRPVGNIEAQLTGFVEGRDTTVQTTEMEVFQGKWKMKANYPTSHDGVALKLDVRNLPVEQLALFARGRDAAMLADITGQVTEASWRFELPHSGGLNAVKLDSNCVIDNLNLNGFRVDRIEAPATLDNGLLKIGPMAAQFGTGRTDALITFDLSSPQHVLAKIKIDKWPYGTPGGALTTFSADTNLDLDLKRQSVSGPLSATIDVFFHNAPLAHTELDADLRGRLLNIRKLGGNVLTGVFNGSATIDLDDPLEASGQVRWSNVDAAALVPIIPALQGLGGKYSGTLTMAPARDPRPLEPVRIDLNVSTDDGHYKSVRIGGNTIVPISAVAYANLDRFVLDHSDIHVAGGVLHLWGRAGRGLVSQAMELSFEKLQLDQFARLSPKQQKPMPGLLTGRLAVVGSGFDPAKLLGQGKVDLTDADLGDFGPIRALYDAMSAGGGGEAPSGYGSVDLRIEQSMLKVTRFSFFNRGLDARGIFNLGPSIWEIPNTPINGQVVGTVRPLKSTKLPLLADFDQVFTVLQSTLTTINVLGPDLNHVEYPPATFSEIGDSMRSLLVGDARSSSGSQ